MYAISLLQNKEILHEAPFLCYKGISNKIKRAVSSDCHKEYTCEVLSYLETRDK